MNASKFMDKPIMDLYRSKNDLNNIMINSKNSSSNDFIDLMNPQSEEETDGGPSLKEEEISPSYDFQPIHHPVVAVPFLTPDTLSANATSPSAAARAWNSLDSKTNSSPLRSYNSLDHVASDKLVLEKAPNVSGSAILLEIDRTMKRYTDSLLHAIDALSTRLSQLESRTRHLEHSMDDLNVSIGNNHGSVDGKLRQLENLLLEVQTDVRNLKDKQEVMEGHIQLAKLQISKVKQSSELPNAIYADPVQQTANSAPKLSGLQQLPVTLHQQGLSLPPNAPPSSQQKNHPPSGIAQFLPSSTSPGSQQDAYFSPSSHTQEAPSQRYQIPPSAQQQQQPPVPSPPQQYPPTPPYPHSPQHPQEQHPSVVGFNAPPKFQSLLSHHCPEESPKFLMQSYPPNPDQPTSQPVSGPPHSQTYYGSPSPMYEPSPQPPGKPGSGFSSVYVPPSGTSEPYPYGGPTSHYGRGSLIKPQPHSPSGGTTIYPQLATARILPQAVPTAGINGGSSSGGNGNRVPIDDVVDKVTDMGFPREHVRETVQKLTENGQSVDLNVVLDKLMNDGDVQAQRGWFGH